MLDRILPPPSRTVRFRAFRWCRAALGVAALGTLWEYTPRLWRVATPENLQLPYASWMPEASPALALVLWIGWLVNAGYFTIGRQRPVAGLLAGAFLGGVLALDQQLYSNHLYLQALLLPLFALADAGDGRVHLLPVRLVQGLVVIVYFFAGLAKLNPEFLSGDVLMDYVAPTVLPHGLVAAMAWATVALELALGGLLLWRPTRRWAWVAGAALHAGMVWFSPDVLGVGMFGVATLATYPLFEVAQAGGVSPDAGAQGRAEARPDPTPG